MIIKYKPINNDGKRKQIIWGILFVQIAIHIYEDITLIYCSDGIALDNNRLLTR